MKADLDLVEEVKSGDVNAFSELVRRHQRGLIRLCLRFTHDLEAAEDVVQESFVKAYEKIHTFEGRSSFKSWLFQIGINTSKNLLRGNKHDSVNIDDVDLSVSAVAESNMVRDDLKVHLQKMVNDLPERQRVAVVLRLYEDLSFKEIAQIMGCPYDTAKANFRHGLTKIKERFVGSDHFAEWSDDEDTIEVLRPSLEVES